MQGTFRVLWDLIGFVLIIGLLFYIPVEIAFTASSRKCNYATVDDYDYIFDERYPAPPVPRSGDIFMLFTNMFFLVSNRNIDTM